MGSWGTSLYSNDTALDVRDTCGEIFRFFPPEEAENKVFNEYNDIIKYEIIDNETASFWYALADWEWKHGVLSEQVKERTLELLEQYAGLEEWEECGNKAAVAKRKIVLDELKERINSPMPNKKPPKLRLKKPKHKPGDIVIMRTSITKSKCEHEYNPWKKPDTDSWLVPNTELYKHFDSNEPVDIVDKYIALLCVGKRQEQCSPKYAPDLFDEYSEYVCYDYASDKEPTVDDLKSLGFLPDLFLNHTGRPPSTENINGVPSIIDKIGWIYKFILYYFNFKTIYQRTEYAEIASYKVLFSEEELNRYEELVIKHLAKEKENSIDSYLLNESHIHFFASSLTELFSRRLSLNVVGLTVDTLLEGDSPNPSLTAQLGKDLAELRKELDKYNNNNYDCHKNY